MLKVWCRYSYLNRLIMKSLHGQTDVNGILSGKKSVCEDRVWIVRKSHVNVCPSPLGC